MNESGKSGVDWQLDPETVDWGKGPGLVPAIVQDSVDGRVLMLGYMNREALQATVDLQRVTFFSRSRQRLWTKGETSENYLTPVQITVDCDGDTLLILAVPAGPVCHRGDPTCFAGGSPPVLSFLQELQTIIDGRRSADPASSYTARLLQDDLHRVAQKVGEEAIETILAATSRDDDALIDESADLVYHLLVLLARRDLAVADVVQRLIDRHGRQ